MSDQDSEVASIMSTLDAEQSRITSPLGASNVSFPNSNTPARRPTDPTADEYVKARKQANRIAAALNEECKVLEARFRQLEEEFRSKRKEAHETEQKNQVVEAENERTCDLEAMAIKKLENAHADAKNWSAVNDELEVEIQGLKAENVQMEAERDVLVREFAANTLQMAIKIQTLHLSSEKDLCEAEMERIEKEYVEGAEKSLAEQKAVATLTAKIDQIDRETEERTSKSYGVSDVMKTFILTDMRNSRRVLVVQSLKKEQEVQSLRVVWETVADELAQIEAQVIKGQHKENDAVDNGE